MPEDLGVLNTQVPPVTDLLERPVDTQLDLGPQHGQTGPQSYFQGDFPQCLLRSRQSSVVRHWSIHTLTIPADLDA